MIVNGKNYWLGHEEEGEDFEKAILNCIDDILPRDFEDIFVKTCFWGIYEYQNYSEDIYDSIEQVIDDSLIYDEDIWTIMRFFQSPKEANYLSAIDEFTDYCARACKKFLKEN